MHRNQNKLWKWKTRYFNSIMRVIWQILNLTRYQMRINKNVRITTLSQHLSRKNLQSYRKCPFRPMPVPNPIFKKMKRRNLPECHWFWKVSLSTSKTAFLLKTSFWHWSESTLFSSLLRSVSNSESSSHSSLLTLSTWSSLLSVVWFSSSCFVSY